MKHSNICPKCGSKEVICISESAMGDDTGNNIYCGFFTVARVNRYICCDCGFTEEWVNKNDIHKIREFYKK